MAQPETKHARYCPSPPSPNSAWSTPPNQSSRPQDPIGTRRRESEPPTCEPHNVLPHPSVSPTEYQHYYYAGYYQWQGLYDEHPNQMWSSSGVEEPRRPQDPIGTKPKTSERQMWESSYARCRRWAIPCCQDRRRYRRRVPYRRYGRKYH